ncbi:peptidoglycan-binding domain-containing protein [Nitratidesulfovibrio sp.]|uniref:peptidoglycan-binding domain-containing protein n=1 Tax=Nitratidesulfovibrio sp. TaxID=2802297 RepID=UPI00333E9A5F
MSSIQTKLKAKGYYSGAVDGVYGLQTKRAILLFQIEHGLATVGLPTQDLLSDLDKY